MAQPGPGGGRFGIPPGQQRAVVIAAAGAVVLLLFFLVVLPNLFGGGGGGTGTTAQPPLVRPPVSTTVAPAPAAPAGSFEQFMGKDPFAPLMSPATPGGGGATPTTVAGGGTTGATTTTVAGAGGASGGTATQPLPSQRVALLNIYVKGGATVADVRVDDTVYTGVAPGQTFASNFQLVSLQGQCGTFLFGDERFQLCKGEEVLK
ncbi:MAG: hypothetical protein JO265_05340 [Acidimicrobiia bacterium]|nr:hypothetical protein [Acidimicrobiia bacterium]